jgi:DNA-binding IclR family transcriptional regulator
VRFAVVEAIAVTTDFDEPRLVAVAPEDLSAVGVRSVDRAASLLLALGSWDGEAGVTDIARSLGFHKSTASRLLSTLQKRGLVDQDQNTGKYRLGLALVRLGGRAEKTIDLRSIATRELEALAETVMETTTLGVLDGDSTMTVAWCYPPGSVHSRAARIRPLHATASGKVLLSALPERDIVRMSKAGFTFHTPHTIVRLDILLEEMSRVRQRGFATSFGEHEPGVSAVAVPVFDARDDVMAALEVRAAGNRISPSRVPELVDRICVAAAAISGHLGGVMASY